MVLLRGWLLVVGALQSTAMFCAEKCVLLNSCLEMLNRQIFYTSRSVLEHGQPLLTIHPTSDVKLHF